jgi:hypothetical protein
MLGFKEKSSKERKEILIFEEISPLFDCPKNSVITLDSFKKLPLINKCLIYLGMLSTPFQLREIEKNKSAY